MKYKVGDRVRWCLPGSPVYNMLGTITSIIGPNLHILWDNDTGSIFSAEDIGNIIFNAREPLYLRDFEDKIKDRMF